MYYRAQYVVQNYHKYRFSEHGSHEESPGVNKFRDNRENVVSEIWAYSEL